MSEDNAICSAERHEDGIARRCWLPRGHVGSHWCIVVGGGQRALAWNGDDRNRI